jgi:transposase
VMAADRVHADDTTVPVLDPGRGKTKTERLWCYARDDRPFAGNAAPAVLYCYSADRKAEHPQAHLASFHGILQADGYAGYARLFDRGVTEAACWAHARRKFFDVHAATKSPLALEALQRIAALYAIEATIRGQSPDARLAIRQTQSAPLFAELRIWLDKNLARIPGKSELAGAIRYTLTRWQALTPAFAGAGCWCCATAAPVSTTTPRNVRCGRCVWDARTGCSLAPMLVANAPPQSTR